MNRIGRNWHRLHFWTAEQAPSERLAGAGIACRRFYRNRPDTPTGWARWRQRCALQEKWRAVDHGGVLPHGPQPFTEIKKKFAGDVKGIKKNAAKGIAFVTNQAITDGQRKSLCALVKTQR